MKMNSRREKEPSVPLPAGKEKTGRRGPVICRKIQARKGGWLTNPLFLLSGRSGPAFGPLASPWEMGWRLWMVGPYGRIFHCQERFFPPRDRDSLGREENESEGPGDGKRLGSIGGGRDFSMIEMVHVSKSFRNQPDVLSDINLRVLKGQFLYITGPSGAGKSTLLKLLYAAELPSAGEIWVNGFHIPGLPRRQIPRLRRSLGIVFQDFKLLAQRTVFENVAFALEVLGVDKREIHDRTRKALQLVGLEPKGDFFPAQLSAGEQQRTAIARAIVNEPPLLLADEPTGNIDGAMAEEILGYFDEINARGTTVVLATHNERLPALLPKERIVLERGRILESSIQPIFPRKPEVLFFE